MFYTVLPQWPFIKPTFKRIARFAPLIGIFIGLSQSFVWLFLKYFNWPNLSIALISISLSLILTGGLHMDGLMDTADGIAAGPYKRIKAMKDSNVGAMGVQSLVIVLILQTAAIIKLDIYAPIAFPLAAFWGRLSQVFAIGNYEYIFKNKSKSLHQNHWKGTSKELQPSLLIILFGIILFLYFNNLNLFNTLLLNYCLFSGLLISILTPHIINKYLEGHSGDSYGACLIITETLILLILSFILVPN